MSLPLLQCLSTNIISQGLSNQHKRNSASYKQLKTVYVLGTPYIQLHIIFTSTYIKEHKKANNRKNETTEGW